MHVVICIVSFRNPGEILDCLHALAQSDYQDFEIVICENGGPDAYTSLVSTLPEMLSNGQRVTSIQAPGNIGYAGGVNTCMRERPDADAWWIVNPDTVPDVSALSALIARLDQGDCDAVGGTLYHPDGRVQAHGGKWRGWLARAESIGHGTSLSLVPDASVVEADMNYILGASMLIGRTFVDRIGLMRDDYFLYCEEVEWCLRALKNGLRLGFAPDALVKHGQGGTTGSADSITKRPRLPIYMDERNKIHVVRDITPDRLPVAAIAALFLLSLRFGRRGAWRQWGYALSGWFAGVRGRRGLPPWMV